MNSNLAIKLYAMLKHGIIKSNAMFWREFSKEKIEKFDIDIQKCTLSIYITPHIRLDTPKPNTIRTNILNKL